MSTISVMAGARLKGWVARKNKTSTRLLLPLQIVQKYPNQFKLPFNYSIDKTLSDWF